MTKRVSIVIPCRNEEKYISKCLDSIIHSDYDKNFLEVLVCDGMSDDDTRKIITGYKENFIRLIDNPAKTTPHALNAGIKNSVGEIIIILGAHSEILPDYITKCIDTFRRDASIGCVGGVLNTISEDEKTSSIAKAMSSAFGVGTAYFRTGSKEGYVDTVAFGAYKKEVFQKAGMFDEELVRNQDDEFNFRISKEGYKIYLNPAIKAKYYVRTSFKKLFRQYFQYGYWKVFVNMKHHTVTTLRQMIPAIFILFIFFGFFLSFVFTKVFFIYLAVFLCYFILGTIASLNSRNYFMTFFSFIILHMGYGLGYLEGIWNFILLNRQPSMLRTSTSR